ncbi:MAG: serine hydrolase [Marinilabiliales bacterium]|nr:serine hydrolase [Marinilabiliales bacterium]
MLKKISIVMLVVLMVTTLMAQSKKKPVKAVRIPHPSRMVSPAPISAERNRRLAARMSSASSMVLVKNSRHLLPMERLDTVHIAVICEGLSNASWLKEALERYAKIDFVSVDPKDKPEVVRAKLRPGWQANVVVLAIADERTNPLTSRAPGRPNDFPASTATLWAERLADGFGRDARKILMAYGPPAFLDQWGNAADFAAVLFAPQPNYDTIDLSAQLLFGGVGCSGKLGFDLQKFSKGEGITLQPMDRLSYVLPEEVGIDSSEVVQRVDSIILASIRNKIFPGCQVLLAQKGKVFYSVSFGNHTYENGIPVRKDDLYDLASVTKVLAPVPALMMLSDQGKFQVDRKMSDYWPDWRISNKSSVLIADLLSHQARLRPGVTLWPMTMERSGAYKPELFSGESRPGYSLRVSSHLWLTDSYPDSVYKAIRDSPLLKTKKYAYSDLGFVLFPKLIENLTGEKFEDFLDHHLYDGLGAGSLMFRPYLKVHPEKLIPTEDDKSFRQELLQGYVHDETAALMGGISGNAGLFGNANDVAKVMQLFLQNGEYGHHRYMGAETVRNWTSSHFKKVVNRRGYGFDKPGSQTKKRGEKSIYPSPLVSEQSFGHSGFTGTFVWADPANGLLFVFLSNRVYPTRNNHKINTLGIRSLLLESLYHLAGR